MTQTSSQAAPLPLQDLPLGNRNHSVPSAIQHYPILIGISGKRIFDENVKADCALAEALAVRFRTLFEALDEDLPETPKVVLTGAAFGTDLIAAETALQIGRNWAVAAILPFDRVLFEEDFHPSLDEKRGEQWRDRYLEHAHTFERVLGSSDKPNPRVLVRELPTLSIEDDGVAAGDRLSRQAAEYDKSYRRNHYEQVGQFIAEISPIMIAVMSSEEQPELSEANGGTARVVAYRRAGCPDAVGLAVARRSAVLRSEWPEVKPLPAGYVWLVDPQKDDCTGRYPVKVLPPLVDRSVEEIYAGHPGRDAAQEYESYVGPLRKLTNALRAWAFRLVGVDDSAKLAESRRLRASLPVARGFNRYNREKLQEAGPADAAVTVDLSPIENIPDALNLERAQISSRQRKANDHAKRGFYWLAGLFVFDVLIYEIFANFFHDSWVLLGCYLLVLAWIVVVAFWERWKLFGAVAEDYRAVAEILRVQRAWCSAGLKARVDREHLQGVDQDLAPIRDCAKTIIAWIFLRHGWKDGTPIRDWAHVRGTSVQPRDLRGEKKSPNDWIGSQLWYFIKNGEDREARAARDDAVSWCLFVASGVLGAVLLTWLVSDKAMSCFAHLSDKAMSFFAHAAHIRLPSWAKAIGFDISCFLWAGLAVAAIKFRGLNHDFRQGWKALVLTGALGVFAAIFLALAFVSAGPLIVCLIHILEHILVFLHILDPQTPTPDVHFAVINAVISVLVWAGLAVAAIKFRGLNHDIRQGTKAFVLTIALGALAAFFLALAFVSAGPLIVRLIHTLEHILDPQTPTPDVHFAVINAVISCLVVLYAVAGAKRYLMERLNIEAEALEYRDARRRFERAERRLGRGSDPVSGAPAEEEAAQRLVYELGCLALAENEAWLKSRRERPLTPIVG
jgi:hypothetical protein